MSEDLQPSKSNEEIIENAEEIASKLKKVDPKIFEGLSKEKRQQIIQSFAFIQKTHIGPLPDPETYEEYARIIPNGADRIMKMAESQSGHRMAMEKKVISGQLIQSNIGQFLAFTICIAAILCGTYCIILGHDTSGSFLSLAGLTGIVTAFIQGKKRQSENLQSKKHKS